MSINDIKRGPLANCIALHSFSNPPESIKEWLEYSIAFFRKYGLEPTRIGSTKTDKNVSFKAGIRQLEKINYHIDSEWLGATPPNHGNDTFDSIFSTCFDYQLDALYLCFDDTLTGFTLDLIHSLTKDLSQFFGAQYGYAYQRLFSQGPSWYVWGAIGGNGKISNEEEEQITQWRLSKVNKRYPHEKLRDIYPYNFLSHAHLTQDIGGKTLKEWIDTDPSHGKLFQLTDTLWSWDVEKEQIPIVKEKLKPSTIIICI